jgi:hypothetical protein
MRAGTAVSASGPQGHDIKEFGFKMKVYNHADKLKQQSFLNPDGIHKIICNGEDLSDMLPEEYTFRRPLHQEDVAGTRVSICLPI